ncbi:MAG: hypothetical protein ACR2RF_07280 [Geminicoccaceae bacterium]
MLLSDTLPRDFTASADHADVPSKILVVFVEQTECYYLRWLKQGFKHCFVALQISDRWVICDSLKNKMVFSIIELPSDFRLSEFYRDRGYIVIAGHGSAQRQSSSIIPEILTCVAVVKRIIGIRSFWTFTPWQLFRLLNSMDDQWRLVS